MTDIQSSPVDLPIARSGPFDPPTELGRLRSRQPVSRLAFPDGTLGWLVTSYSAIRAVLTDSRFSARQELRNLPSAQGKSEPAAPGFFVRMDPPEHTRYRRLLASQFTARRMNQLTPRIGQITEQHLDAMQRQGPPVDLVQAFAMPIPSLVICELLGVPYADRELFQHNTAVALNLEATSEQISAALTGTNEFLRELVSRKRTEPGDDLLSGLITSGNLTGEELTAIAFLLLVAGHETTANMLGLGTFTLLCHPEQSTSLRVDSSIAETAVEELLRYLSIMQFGAMRVALRDLEFGGHFIKKGEALVLSLPAANRDPQHFTDPDVLDLGRSRNRHLAFGLGVHQCLGQQLARIEMRIGYAALFRRFPTLRLAISPDQVPLRDNMAVYGVRELPITW